MIVAIVAIVALVLIVQNSKSSTSGKEILTSSKEDMKNTITHDHTNIVMRGNLMFQNQPFTKTYKW